MNLSKTWTYRGYNCDLNSDDCPFVFAERSGKRWLVDHSDGFYDGSLTYEEATNEAIAKLHMLIDAELLDPGIKAKIPRHFLSGYKFQCSVDELRQLLDRLVAVPGQLVLEVA